MYIQVIATLVSVLLALATIIYNTDKRFTDEFNSAYKKTFELRDKMKILTKDAGFTDFYYEIDIISELQEVEDNILDYLTEMENFFNLVTFGNFIFNKLSSYAFFQRIAALYSYVIYKRIQTKNPKMFQNYCRITKKMSKIKKIKIQRDNTKKICYIGIRDSDLDYSSGFFKESICIFPSNNTKDHFSNRLNQNIQNKEILPFLISNAIKLRKYGYSYMFYNQNNAYNYPKEIIDNTICLNKRDILSMLNNKLFLKNWLMNNKIPVIPFETFSGNDILLSKCSSKFKDYKAFVIQCMHGGGGIGTYYVDKSDFSSIKKNIQALQQYIVSPYLESISVNTHVFIADKQTIISPGSLQIIEKNNQQLCYCGCDYITFRKLPKILRNDIKKLSLKIADLLRAEDYRGIAGIDFLIDTNNNIYCTEINPRFQASTILLDRFLHEKKKASLEANSSFELNEMAFKGTIISTLHFDDIINYSMYYYYKNNTSIDYIREKIDIYKKDPNVDIFLDNINWYLDNNKLDKNSYLFRAVFTHSISGISPDGMLWLNDNIPLQHKPDNMLALKIALLNQGVRLDNNISDIKEGTYESIDIKIKANSIYSCDTDIVINCAKKIHLSQYSPYRISYFNNKHILYYYNDMLTEIDIEKNQLRYMNPLSKKILFVATDRLRIKIIAGCENKNIGMGCSFCNLPISNREFSIGEIIDALEEFKKLNLSIRHVLIGGGSSLSSVSWNKIIEISKYLKKDTYYCDMPISIMTMLPPIDILTQLKDAGIEEVAFNMEISDEVLAKELMPAKYAMGKELYYYTFKEAVKVFGVGNVRSALLVGIDKTENLYNEIFTLTDIGVVPCLSAFRSLPNTDFEEYIGPTNSYLLEVYETANLELYKRHGQIHKLGPNCNLCKNNMLAI